MTALIQDPRKQKTAPIFVLLASTESSYVTGMIYGATGGQLLP